MEARDERDYEDISDLYDLKPGDRVFVIDLDELESRRVRKAGVGYVAGLSPSGYMTVKDRFCIEPKSQRRGGGGSTEADGDCIRYTFKHFGATTDLTRGVRGRGWSNPHRAAVQTWYSQGQSTYSTQRLKKISGRWGRVVRKSTGWNTEYIKEVDVEFSDTDLYFKTPKYKGGRKVCCGVPIALLRKEGCEREPEGDSRDELRMTDKEFLDHFESLICGFQFETDLR